MTSDENDQSSILEELVKSVEGGGFDEAKRLARHFSKTLDEYDDIPLNSDQIEGALDLLEAFEGFEPTTDIYRTDAEERLVYEIEVPGFDQDELHVQYEQSLLTIRGNARRHEYDEQEIEQFERRERPLGGFEKTYQVPDNYTNPDLTYRKGVMIVEFDYVETESGDLDYNVEG